MQPVKILAVDDEADLEFLLTRKFKARLRHEEFQFLFARHGAEALEIVRQHPEIAVALIDIRMPRMDGHSLLVRLNADYPLICPVVVSAYSDMPNIRKAMNQGAYDFLPKPVEFADLEITLKKAIRQHSILVQNHRQQEALLARIEAERTQLEHENRALKGVIQTLNRFGSLVGQSPAMQKIYEQILLAAEHEMPVLIQGETGTGKELVARTIYQLSKRAEQTFVPVDCGSLEGQLAGSELFGHRKGAFTGADTAHPGLFKAAHQGTLFLDEVAELSLETQAKLLRTLDSGEIRPVGSTKSSRVDVRIITASNQNLWALVSEDRFRLDLFHRLHGTQISIPPLRERPEDIPLLCEYFLDHFARCEAEKHLPGEFLDQLRAYHWPGNVRELQHVLCRYLFAREVKFAPPVETCPPVSPLMLDIADESLSDIMVRVEQQVIAQTLARYYGHRERTAAALGITKRTLHRKTTRYQILEPYQRTISPEKED